MNIYLTLTYDYDESIQGSLICFEKRDEINGSAESWTMMQTDKEFYKLTDEKQSECRKVIKYIKNKGRELDINDARVVWRELIGVGFTKIFEGNSQRYEKRQNVY